MQTTYLVTGSNVIILFVNMDALSNLGALLLNSDQHIASFVVETFGGVVVANVLDCLSDDFLVVYCSLGCNFPKYHNHAGLGGCLYNQIEAII